MERDITSDAAHDSPTPLIVPVIVPEVLAAGPGAVAAEAPASVARRGAWLESVGGFWVKINNDWIFNLAGLLAYNFLMAIFPVLLLLLAGCGIVLQIISPGAEGELERALAAVLPGNTGSILVASATEHLKKSVGLLLVVGIVTAFIAGSRLFITLEGCFGIVFRLRGRDLLRQNRMAFGMLLLFLLIVPLVFLISILPASLVTLIDPHGHSPLGGLLGGGARLIILFAAALLFFGAIYAFVPNRRMRWHTWDKNWHGTVVAAVLLVLYELLFRVYQQYFLRADNYGSVAAFAIVILLFLYYVAFILLLGAEINSWMAGQRETAADLPGMLHAIQVHRTLRGAAGPTAGMPSEEMQRHSRAWPIRYVEAVLRRARGGHPLNMRLPRHRPLPAPQLERQESDDHA